MKEKQFEIDPSMYNGSLFLYQSSRINATNDTGNNFTWQDLRALKADKTTVGINLVREVPVIWEQVINTQGDLGFQSVWAELGSGASELRFTVIGEQFDRDQRFILFREKDIKGDVDATTDSEFEREQKTVANYGIKAIENVYNPDGTITAQRITLKNLIGLNTEDSSGLFNEYVFLADYPKPTNVKTVQITFDNFALLNFIHFFDENNTSLLTAYEAVKADNWNIIKVMNQSVNLNVENWYSYWPFELNWQKRGQSTKTGVISANLHEYALNSNEEDFQRTEGIPTRATQNWYDAYTTGVANDGGLDRNFFGALTLGTEAFGKQLATSTKEIFDSRVSSGAFGARPGGDYSATDRLERGPVYAYSNHFESLRFLQINGLGSRDPLVFGYNSRYFNPKTENTEVNVPNGSLYYPQIATMNAEKVATGTDGPRRAMYLYVGSQYNIYYQSETFKKEFFKASGTYVYNGKQGIKFPATVNTITNTTIKDASATTGEYLCLIPIEYSHGGGRVTEVEVEYARRWNPLIADRRQGNLINFNIKGTGWDNTFYNASLFEGENSPILPNNLPPTQGYFFKSNIWNRNGGSIKITFDSARDIGRFEIGAIQKIGDITVRYFDINGNVTGLTTRFRPTHTIEKTNSKPITERNYT